MTLKHGLHHWIVSEYELAHPVHFLCLLYSKKFNWIWFTLDSYNTWPIYELFQHRRSFWSMRRFSTWKNTICGRKIKQVCGIRSLDPYLVEQKRYHLRYLDRYHHLITSKCKYIEKNIKSKLPITAIFERLRIEKKVRQIFSVFSTCSFLILKCEIDPGCKQMLFLEHAQSDEWDSLLVKNY